MSERFPRYAKSVSTWACGHNEAVDVMDERRLPGGQSSVDEQQRTRARYTVQRTMREAQTSREHESMVSVRYN